MTSENNAIESYLAILAQHLMTISQKTWQEATLYGARSSLSIYQHLIPWLIGQQPLIAPQTRSDIAKSFLNYALSLTQSQSEMTVSDLENALICAFGGLARLLQRSESPLESAFLIGLAAYGGADLGWYALSQPDIIDTQIVVGKSRLDVAIRGKSQQWAIELDGHTYHERSEEQAVADRARDRALISQGWTVLRFHRRDIEEQLEQHIHELVRLCDLSLQYVKPDPQLVEHARLILRSYGVNSQAQSERVIDSERIISTGFRDIDEVGLFQRADLMLLAGYPSTGRTSFGLSLARSAAENDYTVLYISGESTTHRITNQILSHITRIKTNVIENRGYTEKEHESLMEAHEWIKQLPIFLSCPDKLTIESITKSIGRFSAKHTIDLIIIDSLQLISIRDFGHWKTEAHSILLSLKRLARSCDANILLISTLEEQIADGHPSEWTEDENKVLRILAAMAQPLISIPDSIVWLYRDSEGDRRNILELYVLKNRANGIKVTFPLGMHPETGLCRDLAYRPLPPTDSEE